MGKANRIFPAWKKTKRGERIPGERAPQEKLHSRLAKQARAAKYAQEGQ